MKDKLTFDEVVTILDAIATQSDTTMFIAFVGNMIHTHCKLHDIEFDTFYSTLNSIANNVDKFLEDEEEDE